MTSFSEIHNVPDMAFRILKLHRMFIVAGILNENLLIFAK